MTIINQDALEREYRNLVFEDIAAGYVMDDPERLRAAQLRWRRMEELLRIMAAPVQETVDVEYEVVEPKRLNP